jgi:hypothetical protein
MTIKPGESVSDCWAGQLSEQTTLPGRKGSACNTGSFGNIPAGRTISWEALGELVEIKSSPETQFINGRGWSRNTARVTRSQCGRTSAQSPRQAFWLSPRPSLRPNQSHRPNIDRDGNVG